MLMFLEVQEMFMISNISAQCSLEPILFLVVGRSYHLDWPILKGHVRHYADGLDQKGTVYVPLGSLNYSLWWLASWYVGTWSVYFTYI